MVILRLDSFETWIRSLKDRVARQRIIVRIQRLEEGNAGDSRSVGGGVSELRVQFGPGFRVYYTERAGKVYVLLAGGDKSTQSADIERAKALAAQLVVELDEKGEWHERSKV